MVFEDSVKNFISNKRRKIDYGISATELRNYFINDPILDWFKHYGELNGFVRDDSSNSYIEHIMSRGNEFEGYVIEELRKKDYTFIDIRESYNHFCGEGIDDTINAMRNGIQIIYQGYLWDSELDVYGIPDLLVRGDVIGEIFGLDCGLVKPTVVDYCWNYYVIDVKCSTIHVGKNGRMLNDGGKRAYKAQLYIYNSILDGLFYGVGDKFRQSMSFILGRRLLEGGRIYSGLERLGVIDFNDELIGVDVSLALNWVREVKRVGMNWDVYNPHVSSLRPNMKNRNDYPWHNAKQIVSNKIGELTRIWNVSVRIRDDVNGGGSLMGNLSPEKGEIVGKMLGDLEFGHGELDLGGLVRGGILNFYVDFEYINGCDFSFGKDTRVHLYMIGVGYYDDDRWVYRVFIPEELSERAEKRNVLSWIGYMRDVSRDYEGFQLVHWTQAEPVLYGRLKRDWRVRGEFDWVDLYRIFKGNGIVFEGMRSFSLKDVARNMRKLGYIGVDWGDSIVDGLGANGVLIKGLRSGESLREVGGMGEIVRYNEVDCRVMGEILGYLSSKVKKNL